MVDTLTEALEMKEKFPDRVQIHREVRYFADIGDGMGNGSTYILAHDWTVESLDEKLDKIKSLTAQLTEANSNMAFIKRWVQRVHDKETSLEEFYGVLSYFTPLKPVRTQESTTKEENNITSNWECFCDTAYFDKWAVRNKNVRGFYAAIHVETKEEAEFITKQFNKLDELMELLGEVKEDLQKLV